MTDKKKPDDIVATPEDQPEILSDDQLSDAQGGLHIGQAGLRKNTVLSGGTTMLKPGLNFETVYGGVGNDDILDVGADLVSNPRKMPDPFSGI